MRLILPARMCGNKRPMGAQSHAVRRVRLDALRPVRGLGQSPNKLHRDVQKDIPMPCLRDLYRIRYLLSEIMCKAHFCVEDQVDLFPHIASCQTQNFR